VLDVGAARIALTTDSFIVTTLFFPGGDIGRLAFNGIVNDLAMSGARPLFLTAAFIMEEGSHMAATPASSERLSKPIQRMAILRTEIGGSRVLDLPIVEQLPRIC
jgi:hydrogenase expression/formation protein HypE